MVKIGMRNASVAIYLIIKTIYFCNKLTIRILVKYTCLQGGVHTRGSEGERFS